MVRGIKRGGGSTAAVIAGAIALGACGGTTEYAGEFTVANGDSSFCVGELFRHDTVTVQCAERGGAITAAISESSTGNEFVPTNPPRTVVLRVACCPWVKPRKRSPGRAATAGARRTRFRTTCSLASRPPGLIPASWSSVPDSARRPQRVATASYRPCRSAKLSLNGLSSPTLAALLSNSEAWSEAWLDERGTRGRTFGERVSPGQSAPSRTRTCNLRIRKPLLYPLSYGGMPRGRIHCTGSARWSRMRGGSRSTMQCSPHAWVRLFSRTRASGMLVGERRTGRRPIPGGELQ